jgi:hypothetical protein
VKITLTDRFRRRTNTGTSTKTLKTTCRTECNSMSPLWFKVKIKKGQILISLFPRMK